MMRRVTSRGGRLLGGPCGGAAATGYLLMRHMETSPVAHGMSAVDATPEINLPSPQQVAAAVQSGISDRPPMEGDDHFHGRELSLTAAAYIRKAARPSRSVAELLAVPIDALHTMDADKLIVHASNFIHQEARLAKQIRSRNPVIQQWARLVVRTRPSLNRLHRAALLQRLQQIVSNRETSLVLATRLLSVDWSERMQHEMQIRFFIEALRAWIVDALQAQDAVITPRDARRLLNNANIIFRGNVPLTGSMVARATQDLDTLANPEELIQLMWSVSRARTHAPDSFWRAMTRQLARLNSELCGKIADVITQQPAAAPGHASRAKAEGAEMEEEEELQEALDAVSLREHGDGARRPAGTTRQPAGHVFSGLTTRQLFRCLRVLKRERWCGDVPILHSFADQALKNIAFETEAAMFSLLKGRQLGRRSVSRRIERTCNLSTGEFLSLLCITGDLGIRFNSSAVKVSDYLIAPTVQHLNQESMRILFEAVERTKCHSPMLVQAILDRIAENDIRAPKPYAFLHAQRALRIAVGHADLVMQLSMQKFLDVFFALCEWYKKTLRASQLTSSVELLYTVSRRFSAASPIAGKIRTTVDELCFQLDRMLEREMVSVYLVTRVLEVTLMLGMREKTEYPHVTSLLARRNALLRRREDDHLGGIGADVQVLEIIRRCNGDAPRQNEEIGKHFEDARTARAAFRSSANDDGGVATGSRVLRELDLDHAPRISKAVHDAYSELLFMHITIGVLRSKVRAADAQRFNDAFKHIGLYNLFHGALIMKQLHLNQGRNHVHYPDRDLPNTLPPMVQRAANAIIMRRLRAANITSSSTDEEVLRLLGQRMFNSAKVQLFVTCVNGSPLTLVRDQGMLHDFVAEVSRRFSVKAPAS